MSFYSRLQCTPFQNVATSIHDYINVKRVKLTLQHAQLNTFKSCAGNVSFIKGEPHLNEHWKLNLIYIGTQPLCVLVFGKIAINDH